MTDRERLLGELRPVSFAIAYRMLGSVSEAEDVVQEALLRIHGALEDGEQIASRRAFVATVTTRLATVAAGAGRVVLDVLVSANAVVIGSPQTTAGLQSFGDAVSMHLPFRATPTRRRRRLPMGLQVWLAAGALLLLLACSTVVALLLIEATADHRYRLSDRAVPYADATAMAALSAKGVANDERGFLMTGDSTFVREADRRAGEVRAALAAAKAAASSDIQRRALFQVGKGFEAWMSAVRHEFISYRSGHRHASITTALGPDRTLRKRYERALARAQALGGRAIRSADASLAAASSRSITILLVWLLGALVVGGGIAYWLVRSIAAPVARLVTILGAAERLDVIR